MPQTNRHPPSWLADPFAITTLSEGYVFARRSGRAYIVDRAGPESDWQRFQELYSPRTLRRLAQDGCTLLLSFSYFRTMSAAAEHDERELTRKAFETCRKIGMRTGVYIADTINPETIKIEHPDCESWVMRNCRGEMVLYADEWWRPRWCRNNQQARDYVKQQVRIAIEDFGVDMIHFDNFLWMNEPERDCHCAVCKEKFRLYLETRYTSRQRKDRFGFADITHITPPYRLTSWKARSQVLDPVHQEWLAFRCDSLTEAMVDFASFIRRLNPKVAVECNPLGIDGHNRSRTSGVLHDSLLRLTDVFWSEEHGAAELHSDGRLTSFIRSHKLSRTVNNKLLCYTNTPLRLAEAMTFGNASLGCIGSQPDDPCRRYIRFYHEHFDRLFAAPRSAARVAVWRANRSLMLDNFDPHRTAVLTEQALITGRCPFDILLDSDLNRLRDYRVLVVPGMSIFEDHNEARLRDYLSQGGSILLLGESGFRDDRLRYRKRPAFAAELGIRGDYSKPGPLRRMVQLAGGGRLAYLPQVVCARHPTREQAEALPSWYGTPPSHWFTPDNAGEILDAVHWCAAEPPMIEVLAPHGVVIDTTRPRAGKPVAIHLVNYGVGKPVGDVLVRFRSTLHPRPRRVRLFSPDRPRTRALPLSRDADAWSFMVHDLQVYDIALVE